MHQSPNLSFENNPSFIVFRITEGKLVRCIAMTFEDFQQLTIRPYSHVKGRMLVEKGK